MTVGREHDTDPVRVITTDHREVERLFQEPESGQGTLDHRRAPTDHVITELVRHSVTEEQFMYPAARKTLPGGDEVADHDIEEHFEAERVMKELEGLKHTEPRFDQLLTELMREIRHHIEGEEGDLLPQLGQQLVESSSR